MSLAKFLGCVLALDSLMPIKDGFYNSELSQAISSKLLF